MIVAASLKSFPLTLQLSQICSFVYLFRIWNKYIHRGIWKKRKGNVPLKWELIQENWNTCMPEVSLNLPFHISFQCIFLIS